MRNSSCDLRRDLLEVVPLHPALVYGIIQYTSTVDPSFLMLNGNPITKFTRKSDLGYFN